MLVQLLALALAAILLQSQIVIAVSMIRRATVVAVIAAVAVVATLDKTKHYQNQQGTAFQQKHTKS